MAPCRMAPVPPIPQREGARIPMKTINLIMGCHSHQPVGNFDHVFQEAYEKAYLPFVDVLERFPDVRITLHYTGPLWDWFLAHEPEYVTRLRGLVERGQVEIMGGGYYEPMLCAIPERDAKAQIHRMQAFCREHFGKEPEGMWLAERVWEPHMARILAESGVSYAALDDSHFLCSGLHPDELYGCYMTEEEGAAIRVFPILERLRYLVPFHPVEETIEYLRERATEDGQRCAVLHDDGEKFGTWPGTFHSVYEEGWLERFFAALTENKDWIRSVTYSDYMKRHRPIGRTYLTCASYQEMMTWALPPDRQRELKAARAELSQSPELAGRCEPFLRGGFWRNFLTKYAESNNMQKRMLRVSKRLHAIRAHSGADPRLDEAERYLHQGQCNCAFWHGQFGGLYLNHLRTAIFEHLIKADRLLDEIAGPAGAVVATTVDFDGDGLPEHVLETDQLSAFFSPHDGGTLFELDFKPGAFNILNTLTRREEAYHADLAAGAGQDADDDGQAKSIHDQFRSKESGLDQILFYDTWRRSSLRDHFYAPGTDVEALYRNEAVELSDLPGKAYDSSFKGTELVFSTAGTLESNGPQPFTIRKVIAVSPSESSLEIAYDIQYRGAVPFAGIFGVEFSVNLLTGSAPDRYYLSGERDLGRRMLGARGAEHGLRHIAVRDEWQKLEAGWRLSDEGTFYYFPLETVSQSESGLERVHQGCTVTAAWPLGLEPGAHVSRKITFYLKRLEPAV